MNDKMNIIKDHEVQKLINELRDIGIEFAETQQLRERIQQAVYPYIKKWRKQAEDESNCILCEVSSDVSSWKEEAQQLKSLCHDLLEAVDKIGYASYCVTRHFMKAIEKHKNTISYYLK